MKNFHQKKHLKRLEKLQKIRREKTKKNNETATLEQEKTNEIVIVEDQHNVDKTIASTPGKQRLLSPILFFFSIKILSENM